MKSNYTAKTLIALNLMALCSVANAALITGESVHDYSSSFSAGVVRSPGNVLDESGLTPQGPDVWHHGNSANAEHMWLTGTGATPWIDIDLGAEYTLTEMHFWNHNESDSGLNRGARAFDVYVSDTPGTADNQVADGTWGTKINTFNPAKGTGAANYAGERFDLTDTAGVRYVRIDITDNYTQSLGGFSEVHFYAIPEPGTYALLAGLTGLTFVMLRRRR